MARSDRYRTNRDPAGVESLWRGAHTRPMWTIVPGSSDRQLARNILASLERPCYGRSPQSVYLAIDMSRGSRGSFVCRFRLFGVRRERGLRTQRFMT
ncbi:hypothetical protein RRG08_051871 [Elysia crispata]|uniref:Uncharacterized protein n=1 Tax=Elysia crispata TaxID=231223 RepID=A0AAE0Z9G8_9GAST|nr:hypothetical protein RRG08_051871 [Elysia crispata]